MTTPPTPPRTDATATVTVLVAGAAVVVHGLALAGAAVGLVVARAMVGDGWPLRVTGSDLVLAGLGALVRLLLIGAAAVALVVAARGRDRSGDRRVRAALVASLVVLLLGVLPLGALAPA
jgi:hypothetical protein